MRASTRELSLLCQAQPHSIPKTLPVQKKKIQLLQSDEVIMFIALSFVL